MTNAFPLVSVVVPTYNQAEYLAACLDSIWFQDYPDLEIIVVADPGPDHTSRVLAEYRQAVESETASYASRYDEETGTLERVHHERYPKQGRSLVVIENQERLGHSASYNLGFQTARGEYCTYVASDDLCHPRMITRLAEPLMADQADFAYSDMFVFNDQGRILREFRLPDYSFKRCFADWYLCGVSKLYRKSLHQSVGWYSEDHVANDHELFLRFALSGARFLRVPEVLYSVRSHAERETDLHSKESWVRLLDESKALVRRAREVLASGGPKPRA